MNPVSTQLLDGGSQSATLNASPVRSSAVPVEQHLEQLKKDKIFLGWRPVLDLSHKAAAAAAGSALGKQSLQHRRAA